MASPRIFASATSVICLLSLKVDATQISNRDVSSLLSLLNHKIAGNKKPVIFILEKERGREDSGHSLQNKPDILTSRDEYDPINIPHYLHEEINKNKAIKKSTPSYLNLLQQGINLRQTYGPQRNRINENKGKEVNKHVLRSALVKKLLRISNSIRCDAKDNCENKCQKKYKGKKVFTCQIQCEVKYECEEPEEEETNACETDCENSCGNSNECNMMSTKGVTLEPQEKSKCNRC